LNIKKKLSTFILTLAMVLSLVPTLSVQAANSDLKILSETKVTAKQAGQWAKSKGATDIFVGLAEFYWKYAPEHGNVNPAIAYVQAAKETGYGKFGGVLNDSYHNPCGLKKSSGGGDTDPNAHQKFESWDFGVQAHLDHLALYAGAKEYPRSTTNDLRHFSTIKGKATTVSALGGKWAPSVTYGEEVNALYKNLLDFVGIEYQNGTNNDNDDNNNNSNDIKNNILSSKVVKNPESIPNPLIEQNVIVEYKVQDENKTEDEKPNITSSIGWKNRNRIWYYYKSDNTKAIGWIKPDTNWYYLKDNGEMATGWININGKWYYLDRSGAMVKGWKQLDGEWYYLIYSGAMLTGWINSGGASYYLDTSTGKMLTNTTIDGYNLDSNGKKIIAANSKNKNINDKLIKNSKLKGIDISNYNGIIDFIKVKEDEVDCIYMKATEGTTFIDKSLETNYKGAKSAGIKTGFYHYLVGTSSPETQAENFYNNIKDKKSDLKPALDIEATGFDLMDYAIRFTTKFKKISNMDVCIYTYTNYINNLDTRLSKYPLWEANYNNNPFNLPSNSMWTSRVGHQYTDKGRVNGINCYVDLNEFTQDILK
jgi:GH25 family lysozyme M1 (1,4-beta-N-acetylmuramidase)